MFSGNGLDDTLCTRVAKMQLCASGQGSMGEMRVKGSCRLGGMLCLRLLALGLQMPKFGLLTIYYVPQ